jgi:hypothetical protein
MEPVASLSTLDELHQYVLTTLCAHDQLDPAQTPLHRAVIKRSGRPCGLFFQVQGPRLLRTYAVWAGEEDRILFYDCSGLRFGETRLSEAPDPLKLAG